MEYHYHFNINILEGVPSPERFCRLKSNWRTDLRNLASALEGIGTVTFMDMHGKVHTNMWKCGRGVKPRAKHVVA